MQGRDWALVIFTLLVQMAIGIVVVFAPFTFIDEIRFPQTLSAYLYNTLFWGILILLILAVLSGMLHLRRMRNVKFVLANLKKSWLSRETLLGLSFGFVILALGLVRLTQIIIPNLITTLLWAGALIGLALVFGMSNVYRLRTVPAWNTWATPISFLLSTLLLGALSLSIAVSLLSQTYLRDGSELNEITDLLWYLGWGSAILLCTQLLLAFLKDRYLLWRGGDANQSVVQVKRNHPILGMLREAFGLLAIGLCILFALQPFSSSEFGFDVAIAAALLLALTSETIGRFLFYASYKRSGL